MSEYEQGYNDGLHDGNNEGYDRGVQDEQDYWKDDYQQLEQDKADLEWEADHIEKEHDKEIAALEKQIKDLEDNEEQTTVDFHELELRHDKLDEKYEDVLWEIKTNWPEVLFDLQMKDII